MTETAARRHSVVDLFCGIGGLAHGFYLEGFDVVAGVDTDPFCRYAFEVNNAARFVQRDVASLTGAEVDAWYPAGSIKVLIGCAPCQPFSTYTNRIEEHRKDRKQWSLLDSFGRLVGEVRPDIVSMENVLQLRSKKVFGAFVGTLQDLDYHAWWDAVACQDYGVPQRRLRLVLLASRFGELRLLEPDDCAADRATVRDVIAHLPPIGAGEVHARDPLHRSSHMSDLNALRIRASVPGGTWRDWDESLRAQCHRDDSGRFYYNVYGRMSWDGLAPTITTQFTGFGNGRFGHPEQHRALSLREGALLQTFPSTYRFFDPAEGYYLTHMTEHIGNAVPVRLASVIAQSIRRHLDFHAHPTGPGCD